VVPLGGGARIAPLPMPPPMQESPVPPSRSTSRVPLSPPTDRASIPANMVRGALIGVVETVPGVSGGTMALVTGIYDELINSAGRLVSAAKQLVLGPHRLAGAGDHLAAVQWRIIVPVAVGMVVALLGVAGPVSVLVDAHPVTTRAAFFGMVAASLAVPLRLAGGPVRMRDGAVVAAAAVAAFALVSLPPVVVDPHPVLIVAAATAAVCALLLPGLSGSFLLLAIGLYQPTLQAVADRDLAYLGLFVTGCLLGLAAIVKVLQWVLAHHHRTTMVVVTGLMLGAMRSLWPWQLADRTPVAPDGDWLVPALVGAAGFCAVVAVLGLDARTRARTGQGVPEEIAGVEHPGPGRRP
jgi:putative membrane protein